MIRGTLALILVVGVERGVEVEAEVVAAPSFQVLNHPELKPKASLITPTKARNHIKTLQPRVLVLDFMPMFGLFKVYAVGVRDSGNLLVKLRA